MSDFNHQISILREVEKARNTIKRKYDSIKSYKIDSEKAFNESYKPIIEPLNKLVENENVKNKVNKKIKLIELRKKKKKNRISMKIMIKTMTMKILQVLLRQLIWIVKKISMM